ncbi:ADOP family duplicated permease [Actomonas aquatica]|uniref:ADOP family duplicated permease n=1 Tax=Actomonas aquatica TaxID=2866162 RepID=A0ABZ1C2Y4_9BACT|nr:ADOP family duplicated permease [Opitutus sp. WL0086]WRQ86066.1 ADOP family duplicated permease [Opitutus sp. WL0086]
MKLFNALARLFGRRRVEAEMDEEMQFHLEHLTERYVNRGLAPAAARRAALREFGGIDQTKEEVRDAWGARLLQDLARDLRYAVLSLRRTPGFTAIAVVTLALGISVNTVMFAFVRDAVLQPLARNDARNLVAVYTSRADADRGWRYFSYPEVEALAEQTDVFANVAAYTFDVTAIGTGRDQNLQRRVVGMVSHSYFDLLGVTPHAGRFFSPDESRPNASIPVAVADYGYWERAGQPANFIGSTVRVKQRDYTIVGIAPRGFLGLSSSVGPDLWLPLGEAHHIVDGDFDNPNYHRLSPIAQLAPGLSAEAARARLPAVTQNLWNQTAPNEDRQLLIGAPSTNDLQDDQPNDESFMGLFATLSLGLSAVVLVVACLNLANLLLARGAARRKEIAVRLSLGASRFRIVRQLVTETFLLALMGGTLGLLLSTWVDHMLMQLSADAFAVSQFSFNVRPFVDTTTLLATLGFSAFATLVSSLGPALRLTRPSLITDIKATPEGGADASRSGRFFSLSNLLVVAQIACSLALLFSAALFLGSVRHARHADRGFDPAQQVVANLDYRITDMDTEQIAARQQTVLTRLRERYGADAVATASNIPYNFDLSRRSVYPLDALAQANPETGEPRRQRAGYTTVSGGYFDLLDIQVLRGRTFNATESTDPAGPRVVVIDQQLATFLYGDADPIGQRLYLDKEALNSGDTRLSHEVIGVVRSPRDHVFNEPPARLYRPLVQDPSPNLFVHLRQPDPIAALPDVRRTLDELEPLAPLLAVRPLASYVEQHLSTLVIEICGLVFGLLGAIALVLAVAGVYGVKAHQIARRTREIGIRLAIGASPRRVVRQIVRQGLAQAAVGLAIGLGLAFLAGQVLASMLLQGTSGQSLMLLGSAAVLATAVFLATWIPARRAARVDPAVTLKSE